MAEHWCRACEGVDPQSCIYNRDREEVPMTRAAFDEITRSSLRAERIRRGRDPETGKPVQQ